MSFSKTTVGRLVRLFRPSLVIGDRGNTVSAKAIAWLESHHSDGPVFLWLHYVEPHAPYSRDEKSNDKSLRGDLSTSQDLSAVITEVSPNIARLRSGEIRLRTEEKAILRGLYHHEVARVDSDIGAVLRELDRLRLGTTTLVVFVSDHGEEFWEHGGVEHGHTVYEEVVHIPWIMRWPARIHAGLRRDQTVSIVDVPSTVLDVLGLDVPAALDGRSVKPLLEGTAFEERPVFIENMLFADERSGLRTSSLKYVRWETGKEELYDLRADPAEQRDLVADEQVVESMRQLLIDLHSRDVEFPAPFRGDAESAAVGEAMRALGYAQ